MDNLKRTVMAGDFKMKGSRWEKVSEEGKQLVTNLLKVYICVLHSVCSLILICTCPYYFGSARLEMFFTG